MEHTRENDVENVMARDPRIYTLLVGLLCGVAAVAIDVDHLFVLWWEGKAVTLTNLVTQAGRPLHFPVLFILSFVCIYTLARLDRLLMNP